MLNASKVTVAAKSSKCTIEYDGADGSTPRSLQFSFSNENLHSVARLIFMYQLKFVNIPATKAVIPFKHTCGKTVVESKSPFTWSLDNGMVNFNLDTNVFVRHHWAGHADLLVPVLTSSLGINFSYHFMGTLKGHPYIFVYKYVDASRDTEIVMLTDRKSFYVAMANSMLIERGWYSFFGYDKDMLCPDWDVTTAKQHRGEQAALGDRYRHLVKQYNSVDDLLMNGVIAEERA
ncbi:hypothetical protein AH06_111 [Erwinia phage AH06]|nr:hypothetical protein AH06_111 [Erwinia phage AH06]